ncbi:MAG: ribosome recycling factor [Prevotella sp.]|nr:ribosome recycling factor [Prevotella sp.]
MNNYIIFELGEFDKKLNGYLMLFNYRITNLCVKAEPTALLPVTVVANNVECNLEEVADMLKPDEFSFDVYPKNQNELQDIIDGVMDVHPEFKLEVKTDKDDSGKDVHHLVYTMPEVDKNRRDLLNETTKIFHKECQANLDATYAKLQDRLVEPFTKMPIEEADEAKDAFEKLYNDYKDEADKLLEGKLMEIEEGYQRYLGSENSSFDDSAGSDVEMEVSEDPEIEALFNVE